MNASVTLILFDTVHTFFYVKEHTGFTWKSPFVLTGDFCLNYFCSICIGMIYGLIASLMFKYIRALTLHAALESLLIFCIAYMAYDTAAMLGFCGTISLLTCGIVMAHYAWYSISPKGKHGSYLVF